MATILLVYSINKKIFLFHTAGCIVYIVTTNYFTLKSTLPFTLNLCSRLFRLVTKPEMTELMMSN